MTDTSSSSEFGMGTLRHIYTETIIKKKGVLGDNIRLIKNAEHTEWLPLQFHCQQTQTMSRTQLAVVANGLSTCDGGCTLQIASKQKSLDVKIHSLSSYRFSHIAVVDHSSENLRCFSVDHC